MGVDFQMYVSSELIANHTGVCDGSSHIFSGSVGHRGDCSQFLLGNMGHAGAYGINNCGCGNVGCG